MTRFSLALLAALLLTSCGSSSNPATEPAGPTPEAATSAQPPASIQPTQKTEQPTQRPTEAAPSACEQAFTTAAKASSTQDTQEQLQPAFTACGSFEEWKAASDREPNALDGTEPAVYASNQCQYVPALAPSPVCTSLPG